MAPVFRLTAWSPSRLATYEQCPALAKYRMIDRLPEPPAAPLERGTRVHKEAEEYVIGHRKALPKDLARVAATAKRLRKAHADGKVRVEASLAVRKDWTPCDWFARDVYGRFKLDILEELGEGRCAVYDWKTGRFNVDKVKGEYAEQLEVYGLAVLSARPDVNVVLPYLVFTDSGDEVEGEVITREQLPALQAKWDARVVPFLTDEEFNPTPNYGCRWCAFAQARGGPCRF